MRIRIVPARKGGQQLFTTGVWALAGAPERGTPQPPFQGRGWVIGVRTYHFQGQPLRSRAIKDYVALRGFNPQLGAIRKVGGHAVSWKTPPELVIFAPSREAAQRGANLLFAARLLRSISLLFVDHFLALAEDSDEPEFDHYRNVLHAPDLLNCADLAAKLSRRREWQYAAMKFWASYRACGPDFWDFHPSSATHRGVTDDPLVHVACAQAIVSAYGVLEELGLELRASKMRPSKINGAWNPIVKTELEQRLVAGGIDLRRQFNWVVRGSPTRIQLKRPVPKGVRQSWTYGSLRDRRIDLIDAIAEASWLRSRVSAHRTSQLTSSLTEADVHNVQMLARRLLLERVGFLPAAVRG